jgi:murein endopeptidase
MAGAVKGGILVGLAVALLAVVPARPASARGLVTASLAATGTLRQGVQLPAESFDWVTWDPVLKQTPNRGWRRWGTVKLVETTELVLRQYHDAHPDAPRVLVGDLSRRHGGFFGKRYGGLGHASHQTGLDVDVYYPRLDGLERAARRPDQVDVVAAQELVDRFVAWGAIKIFVGPDLPLHGPRRIVSKLVYHDDHLHVRLSARRVNRPVAG